MLDYPILHAYNAVELIMRRELIVSKNILNLLCSLIVGLVIAVGGVVAQKAGIALINETIGFSALIVAIICYIVLMPSVTKKITHLCNDYDWAEECAKFYQSIPQVYRRSFWVLFGFINLAFLFHTMHFMWGNEDWGAIRSVVNHHEGIQKGAFSAYWLQELIFDGKILPVANNLWAFAGLSLSAVLLAVYWNLPQRVLPIVVAGLLFAVTPYTLSVLYFVKTSLGLCWQPVLVLTALLLAEKNAQSDIRTYICNILSVLLFLVALGTYMPVINFIAIAVLGRIFLKTVYADISIKDAAQRSVQGLANFTAALLIYWLILFLLKETGRLAEATVAGLDFDLPLLNLGALIQYAFAQFAVPLPFMDVTYKAIYLIFILLALFTMILKAPNGKAAARGLAIFPFLIIATMLALIFASEPANNFGRISFYGLPFFYTLMFVLLIRLGGAFAYRATFVLAFLLIFMNFVRIAYAEKVWKFGWDAETKLAERIITRLEKMPEFNIDRQYKLLQIGEKSLRTKYYLKGAHEAANGELLGRAYYPAGAAKDAYNFFYQTDFLADDAHNEALQEPAIRNYLLNQARAWPAKESLFIYGDYIVLILDDKVLANIQKQL